MPRVAILTAAFIDTPEKDDWLGETIQSVQEQNFDDWEMIIVDDASPIPVPPSGDPRVRLVRASKQQGPAMCRNTAVALARADAIFPLDADDKLASPEVLGTLFEHWEQDPHSVYYGDMQYLQNGTLGKIVRFPEYDFQKVLDPKGVIPVSAMHSVECWEAAGGWKPELQIGLEDVEYWIAAGAAGFCGTKVDLVTLVYRRHKESRTSRMRAIRQEGTARNLIREMHAELYGGKLPMGCCGGSRSKQIAPKATVQSFMGTPPPRELQGTDAPTQHTTIWVRYNGRRTGEFGMRGPVTGVVYKVAGTGAEFEIYTVDASLFRRSGRGRDFSVGIAPPAKEPEPEPAPEPQPEYIAPKPQLAEIMALDEVARGERGVAEQTAPAPSTEQAATPQPEAVQPPPPLVTSGPPKLPTAQELDDVPLNLSPDMDEVDDETAIAIAREQSEGHPLQGLGLGRHQELLETEGWTVLALAKANPDELIPYPGIGAVTAEQIIKAAQRHLAGQ